MKQRISQCAKLLRKNNFSGLLLSNPVNISYLTGAQHIEGYLLITSNSELFCFTNFIYKLIASTILDCQIIVSSKEKSIFQLITNKTRQLNLKRIGFEAKHLPFLEQKTLRKFLITEKTFFVETNDFIEKIRMIKTKEEIKLIRKAVQVSLQAFKYAQSIYSPQLTEKQLAIEIERFLSLLGDKELAFPAIVASGKNTVYPHYQPKEIPLGDKNFLIDLGSRHSGYCADLTRIFFYCKMPLLFRKVLDTVKKAQALAIKKIKSGAKISEIDKAARGYIEKKGWGKYFGHGLGHGVGQSVHEPPYLGPNNNQVLREGMVITVEPAIYITNKFGIRLEDMILVKKNKAEIISTRKS